MRMWAVIALVFGGTVLCGAAQAAVDVSFRAPENFRDVRNTAGSTSDTLDVIREHLRELGSRYLSPDQTLRVEILDVDLAGEIEWWHGPNEIRFMREINWPRISLRYSLDAPGDQSRSGEEIITDMEYLIRPGHSGTVLPYEKAMLTQWFRARFAQR